MSGPGYRPTEAKVRGLVRQVLLAVEFIHAAGILHLDITPYNIKLAKQVTTFRGDKQLS